jgi:light-regulated signal transduction histidine kinase (bacteriophytochrome)
LVNGWSGPALGEQGMDYLQRMTSAADRMEKLIQGLLTYSRVTTRAQPFVPVDLNVVVREVLQDLELLIERSGGQVTVAELPTVAADATQLRQVFQNLIGNALKFRDPQRPPQVRVTAEPLSNAEQGGGPVSKITISDNGIGFESRFRNRIFEVFQRLHTRDEYEGSGMGLAVCRKIIERHGGSIQAESVLGQGSTFTFSLPMEHIEQPA